MMMWRIAQASLLLGSGGARPARMTTMAPRAAAGRTFGPERRISKISLAAANASDHAWPMERIANR